MFWFCDFAATRLGVDFQMAAACGIATEQLQRSKFGGNFERLMVWWQANKADQHRRLEREAPLPLL